MLILVCIHACIFFFSLFFWPAQNVYVYLYVSVGVFEFSGSNTGECWQGFRLCTIDIITIMLLFVPFLFFFSCSFSSVSWNVRWALCVLNLRLWISFVDTGSFFYSLGVLISWCFVFEWCFRFSCFQRANCLLHEVIRRRKTHTNPYVGFERQARDNRGAIES